MTRGAGRTPGGAARPPRAAESVPGAAELAAEISRVRRRLMRPGMLSHPRVGAELDELDRAIVGWSGQRGGRHRIPAAREPVGDKAGYDLKPDPLSARTGAELVGVLRAYREWAGKTPFREMAARTRWEVAHSTMCVALKSETTPPLKVVLAIVAGCGGGEEDQQAFATAWRRICADAARDQPGQVLMTAAAGTASS